MSIPLVTKAETFSGVLEERIKIDPPAASEGQEVAVPAISENPAVVLPDIKTAMLEMQRKQEIEKLLADTPSEKVVKTERDLKVEAEIQTKISKRLGEDEKQIREWIDGLLKGTMTVDKLGNVIPCNTGKLLYPVNFSIYHSETICADVVVWPNGQAIHIPSQKLYMSTRMTERPIFSAMDLQSGKEYLAAFATRSEYDVQQALNGKRGIDQICLHAEVENRWMVGKHYKHLLCTEKNETLDSALNNDKLTKEDISVIVKDLLHAISNLEDRPALGKEEPTKRWIAFGTAEAVRLDKVFLTREPSSKRVISARLGDFAEAEFGYFGSSKIQRSQMQRQRNQFMQFMIVPLMEHLQSIKGSEKISLAELCDDPLCQNLIVEIEKNYRET